MADFKLISYVDHGIVSVAQSIGTNSYGVEHVGAHTMWNKGYKGEAVKIAVLDTGFAPHEHLPNVSGRNFTNDDNGNPQNFTDYDGHGTHVIGTIIQSSANYRCGVAPNVELRAIKVLDQYGLGSWMGIYNGIRDAIVWKADIISMSLGSSTDFPIIHSAIQDAVNAGILVVSAAGNEGDGISSTPEYSYPAAYPEVVCVGACDNYGFVPAFSNTNDQLDMVAPGVDIRSTTLNNTYSSYSGTSMATPHVAGAAALIKQQWEKRFGFRCPEPVLYDLMIKKCVAISAYDPYKYGHGRIDASRILPKPSLDDLTGEQALQGLAYFGVIDSPPTFWLNLIKKFNDNPEEYEDFRYVELLIKKFYQYIC